MQKMLPAFAQQVEQGPSPGLGRRPRQLYLHPEYQDARRGQLVCEMAADPWLNSALLGPQRRLLGGRDLRSGRPTPGSTAPITTPKASSGRERSAIRSRATSTATGSVMSSSPISSRPIGMRTTTPARRSISRSSRTKHSTSCLGVCAKVRSPPGLGAGHRLDGAPHAALSRRRGLAPRTSHASERRLAAQPGEARLTCERVEPDGDAPGTLVSGRLISGK
jgi:hypothetical protein